MPLGTVVKNTTDQSTIFEITDEGEERIICEGVWAPRVKTLMFNGYGDEVASLYTGMDLKKYF